MIRRPPRSTPFPSPPLFRSPRHYQPTNVAFGLLPELPQRIRDKAKKRLALSERALASLDRFRAGLDGVGEPAPAPDRKSTRLHSSHLVISYAVFCLQKKHHRVVRGIHRPRSPYWGLCTLGVSFVRRAVVLD